MKVYIVFEATNKGAAKPSEGQVFSSMDGVYELYKLAYQDIKTKRISWITNRSTGKIMSFEEWLTSKFIWNMKVPVVYESVLDEMPALSKKLKQRITTETLKQAFQEIEKERSNTRPANLPSKDIVFGIVKARSDQIKQGIDNE